MDHDNVIKLIDVFTPACTYETCNSVYLVTELQNCDLKAVIHDKTFQVNEEHIKCFVYQILRGLKYIHSAGVIHRDLKPSNVVINTNDELKILDFGLARQTDVTMTGYIATRWYRAPEVLFNWTHYTKSADIWSVGCIMAELILRRALFPGQDVKDHFDKIIALLGSPSEELMKKFTSIDTKVYIASLPKKEKQDLSTLFPNVSKGFLDLLERMFDLDPDSRISAEEGLAHPYLSDYADLSDEPSCEIPYDHKEEEDETREVDGAEGWRNLIFDEITPSTEV
jgi:p38 MAP kinase